MRKHVYSEDLEKEIIATNYIPRKFKSNEKMKIHHKYWIPEYGGTVKVVNVDYISGREYYTIKFDRTMNACLPYPVTYENIYELLHNSEGLESKDIINSNESYSGAEIKYWFIIKRINFDDPKYKGFYPFINDTSMNVVSDNKYYYVRYNPSNLQKFKMVLDREKNPL